MQYNDRDFRDETVVSSNSVDDFSSTLIVLNEKSCVVHL